MNPLIEVEDLSKVYRQGGREVIALRKIYLEINEGEFVALMGPSGSGKSTLLHIFAGMDRPTNGKCRIKGQDLANLTEKELTRWRHAHVGFVFQTFNLIPVLTAFENVEMPLLLTKLSAAERRAHVESVLELVGLADRMDHLPKELSGGQEQRVATARALVSDPTLLLADEPTGNLDGESALEILALLRRLNTAMGKTIVMVTHDLKAAGCAGRILQLEKGELQTEAIKA